MKKYLKIFFLTIFIINLNCGEKNMNNNKKTIIQTDENFYTFIKNLKIICKNKSEEKLNKILDYEFKYTTNDKKDKYNKNQILKNFEFKEVLKIINHGGYEFEKVGEGYQGWSPKASNMGKYKYVIYYVNDSQSKGWKISSIDEGSLPDEGYTEPTEEEWKKMQEKK
ncbi:MAG: hypothetical protein KKH98_10360 [Spirochaetes bacterium]|nr:hypothetical protein [Spirochaetota bacterium]